jgi:16S rRNA (adenine1518-N6/adenine1519-N6)-dimethyltransferase
MPRYLGQHFLKNTAVIKKIVAALDLQSGEIIIEVGPGHGELTIPLAAAAKKIGAKIFAVEKDKELAEALRAKVEGTDIGDVEIISDDILLFLKTGGASGISTSPFKIAGNIPYYLTGHLLRTLGELNRKPDRAVLMMQAEVAERICATPPRMNRLAASVQFWAKPKIVARVPRTDFSPPPEVDSAVIELINLPGASNGTRAQETYYAAMRAIFAQPRKTTLNNIAGHVEAPKNDLAASLLALGIDPKSRPQDLSVKNIAEIARSFFS